MRRTIEQERANFCLEKVKDFSRDKKFKTNGTRLAELIISNGLVPTLAFYKARVERKPVYNILNEWLKEQNYVTGDSFEELINADVSKLRLATMEALAFAQWLKRIIEVEI